MRLGKRLFLFLSVLLALGSSAEAAHTTARLLLPVSRAAANSTILAGVELRMDKGWHTYWRSPGASGMATAIKWQLPAGVTAGEIRWPLPDKKPEGEFTTYTYSDVVVLIVPLQIGPVQQGVYPLKAEISWLECEVQCVPGDASIEIPLVVGAETTSTASTNAPLIAEWNNKVPLQAPEAKATARWEGSPEGNIRKFSIEWTAQRLKTASSNQADFFPFADDAFEVLPETKWVGAQNGKIKLLKEIKKFSGDWPKTIPGVLVEGAGRDATGYEVALGIGAGISGDSRAASGSAPQSLWLMLLYAFIGGLILNIMPCVLPVISLKILGFVNSAKDSPQRVRNLGIVYAAGVLFSFIILAGLMIGVKAAGHSAGWGMQFGNPIFIVALTVLITLVALNLFGVFEVNAGGKVMDAAGCLAAKQGTAGAFFNGVLATVLATPCTAPFFGVALGFALFQPAPIIVLIFVVAGAGLASPYVLLSWNPRLLKLLPKPGPWMERFKIAMGFPMLATAVWLISLLPVHYGSRTWWVIMFLVLVAAAAWVFGEFIQRGRNNKPLAWAVVVALLLSGYWLVLESQAQWRTPMAEGSPDLPREKGGIAWEKWSPEAVANAREQGRPILVDFTADWCITCQANKKIALEIPQVRARLKEINAVALLGDYTRLPAAITAELNRFGRAGVPLVLVYPKQKDKEPMVLPAALTPGIVMDALNKAEKGA